VYICICCVAWRIDACYWFMQNSFPLVGSTWSLYSIGKICKASDVLYCRDCVPAFRVKLGTNYLNCVDVPLNPTHSLTLLNALLSSLGSFASNSGQVANRLLRSPQPPTLSNCIPLAIKTCHFILDYNFRVSWWIFELLVPMVTVMNTLQFTHLVVHNRLITS